MSNQSYNVEKFDAFLSDQLSEAEAGQFMEMLKRDPEMAKAFAVHKSMLATITRQGRSDLKGELKAIHKEKPRLLSVSNEKNRRSRIPWLAAASILLLVMATWFFTRPMSNQQLAANFYEPYELSGNVRGENSTEKLATINKRYIDKEYASAIPLMREYLTEQPNDLAVRLALVMSLHEIENTPQALIELKTIERSGDAYFLDHVHWYSALFALEKNDQATAIAKLKLLAAEADADHHAAAKKLLSKIQ